MIIWTKKTHINSVVENREQQGMNLNKAVRYLLLNDTLTSDFFCKLYWSIHKQQLTLFR